MLTDSVRTCALAGCDSPVPERPGRSVPTYCSASHRARAREARRAERHDAITEGGRHGTAGDTPSVPVRWQPAPSRITPVGPRRDGPASLAPRLKRQRTAVHRDMRRRALASLGAAGIMVAAGGFVVSSSTAEQAEQALAQLGTFAFSMESGYQWAYRANLTLASLNRQIDDLALADREWRELGRVGPNPPAVAELQSRLALLHQHRTVLLSQLAAWESLLRSQGDLAEAAERDGLRHALSTAVQNPVPDDPGRTTAVVSGVRDLGGHPQQPPLDARHHRVPAVLPRDGNADRPRADVGNAAPPGGRSGDELIGTVGGSAETTTATADDVGSDLTGGSGAGGSGPARSDAARSDAARSMQPGRMQSGRMRLGRRARRRRSPMVRRRPGTARPTRRSPTA